MGGYMDNLTILQKRVMKLVSKEKTVSFSHLCHFWSRRNLLPHPAPMANTVIAVPVWRKQSTAWRTTILCTHCFCGPGRSVCGIALFGEALIPISSLFSPAFACKVIKSVYTLSSKKLTASHKISPDPSFPFATRTPAAKLPDNLSDSADLRKDGIFCIFCYFQVLHKNRTTHPPAASVSQMN